MKLAQEILLRLHEKVVGGHRKFSLTAFVLVMLVKVVIGIQWLKAVLLPLGNLVKMLILIL